MPEGFDFGRFINKLGGGGKQQEQEPPAAPVRQQYVGDEIPPLPSPPQYTPNPPAPAPPQQQQWEAPQELQQWPQQQAYTPPAPAMPPPPAMPDRAAYSQQAAHAPPAWPQHAPPQAQHGYPAASPQHGYPQQQAPPAQVGYPPPPQMPQHGYPAQQQQPAYQAPPQHTPAAQAPAVQAPAMQTYQAPAPPAPAPQAPPPQASAVQAPVVQANQPPAPPAPAPQPAPQPTPQPQERAVETPVAPSAEKKKRAGLTIRRPGPEVLDIAVRPDLSLRMLLDHLVQLGASDLHLSSGAAPSLRLQGDIRALEMAPLQAHEAEQMLLPLLAEEQREVFLETGDLDFAIELPGIARFRVNFFRQQRGMGTVMRIIPKDIPRLDQLGLPASVQKLGRLRRGLVLVTGPTGSGKSTTLAAIINEINHTRPAHIITIEDPLEFVHDSKMCKISHREVGTHASSFADALRAAIREDPDIILVGEMRDLDTVSRAIEASEMGLLVLGTLHTNSASKAVDRIIDIFPSEEQEQIRTSLSEALKAVVAQQLLKRADGRGRCAAHEVLIGTPALSNMIREGKTHQIPSFIQTGREQGMQLMDHALIELIQKGIITPAQAKEKASDLRNFQRVGITFE